MEAQHASPPMTRRWAIVVGKAVMPSMSSMWHPLELTQGTEHRLLGRPQDVMLIDLRVCNTPNAIGYSLLLDAAIHHLTLSGR